MSSTGLKVQVLLGWSQLAQAVSRASKGSGGLPGLAYDILFHYIILYYALGITSVYCVVLYYIVVL